MSIKEKPYEFGLIVGRFQAFHKGHEQIIDRSLGLCGRVGVFIGSSQESGTVRNPFSYETREGFIKKIYGENVYVFPLPDIGAGNVPAWGDYVMQNAIMRFGRTPDLLISGSEARRADWLDSAKWSGVSELYIPKTIAVSASDMRGYLLNNDIDSWKKYTDPLLWDQFDALRAQVTASQCNTETESV